MEKRRSERKVNYKGILAIVSLLITVCFFDLENGMVVQASQGGEHLHVIENIEENASVQENTSNGLMSPTQTIESTQTVTNSASKYKAYSSTYGYSKLTTNQKKLYNSMKNLAYEFHT